MLTERTTPGKAAAKTNKTEVIVEILCIAIPRTTGSSS
jgi:hypothetical protein